MIVCSDRNTALRYAQDRGLMYTTDGKVYTKDESEFENFIYPKILDKYVKGYISHVRQMPVSACDIL